MRSVAPTQKPSIDRVHAAAGALKNLQEVLEGLKAAPGIHPETRQRLAGLGQELGRRQLSEVLERALDELNAVPRGRVDTDRLPVGHGAVTCFAVWAQNKADRHVPKPAGRSTTDDYHLIERFMKEHRGLKISARRVPFGGANEAFLITGTKAARERFVADPRWPRLLEALEDIYWTDRSGGYSDDVQKLRRKIQDPTRHVFGDAQ